MLALPHVNAVHADTSAKDVIQAGDQADNGALAGAGGTDDRDALSRFQREADIAEDQIVSRILQRRSKSGVLLFSGVLFFLISKIHMGEGDSTGGFFRDDGIGRGFDLDGHVEIIENSGKKGHGPDPVDLDVQELVDGAVHSGEQGDEHGDITDRETAPAVDHEDPAGQIEQHGPHAGESADGDSEPAPCHPLADVIGDHLFVFVYIAVIFIVLPPEELDKELTADGHGLAQDPVDAVIAGLCLTGERPAGFAGPAGGDDEQRHDQHSQDSHENIFMHHGDDGSRQCNGVGEDAGEGVGNDRFDTVDIACHSCDDIPLAAGGEKLLGHLFQMPEHAVAHVKGDMLGDPGV